jgi:ATP-dependent helicase/nuclease subunit B
LLRLYRGRETVDKEKFIYGKIDKEGGHTIVIVPDQYTLAAERQAMSLRGKRVLFDIEVLSLSRLGHKLIHEAAEGEKTYIDEYGRHMLLSRILTEKDKELKIFSGFAHKEGFVEAVNDFISKAKQYNFLPGDIKLEEQGSADDILAGKLHDLDIIYKAYESKIEGKYTDSEDLLEEYVDKIGKSEFVKSSNFWIYGFDSFTPKNLKIIGALCGYAPMVNIFLTYDTEAGNYDLFNLGRRVTYLLEEAAKAYGSRSEVFDLGLGEIKGEKLGVKRPPAVKEIERQLYAPYTDPQDNFKGLRIGACTDYQTEAETAASFVLSLIRDEGYRLSDIVMICNDPQRTGIIARVFDEYGMDVFTDSKRPIISSPIAIFIVGLISIQVGGYQTGDIFRLLKTGLTCLSPEETEKLENYTEKYKIRGRMWKKPFSYGVFEYGEEGLKEIESYRIKVVEFLEPFEELYRKSKSSDEFIKSYYTYLIEKADLADKIKKLAETQREQGFPDRAEETEQIWDIIMSFFGQIAELNEGEEFRGDFFLEMLESGLARMEVGVLPPTSDDILLGTTGRTRFGHIKAVIVVGANEGFFPIQEEENPLFSPEEIEKVSGKGHIIGDIEELRKQEESVSIYRALSSPEEHLMLLYSEVDGSGDEARPSELIDRLLTIFPGLPIEEDVIARGNICEIIGGGVNTSRYFADALNKKKEGLSIAPAWQEVGDWLREKERDKYDLIKAGFLFDGSKDPISKASVKSLYAISSCSEEYAVSPSALEKFSRCPFSHFISYGLKPDERRSYEVSGRELGDLYHYVLMELSKTLTDKDLWETIEEPELIDLVTKIIEDAAKTYRDGLFKRGRAEEYWKKRAEDACLPVCKALIMQVRKGNMEKSAYEIKFGRFGKLAPIVKKVEGSTVYIEGKIDRLDIIQDDRVKVIDYKTGKEKLDRKEVEAGYRLQLMLYLEAAQEGKRKPAGVFYFLISDPLIDLDRETENISEKISSEMRKVFKLNGIMVDDDRVVKGIAGDFDRYSDILPLRKVKTGEIKGTSRDFLVDEEEFEDLQNRVKKVTEDLCRELLDGKIDAHPKKSSEETPCSFCLYHSICRFNTLFAECSYDVVK